MTRAEHSRTPRRHVVIVTVVGVALGAANSLSNAFGSPYSPVRLRDEGILPLEVLGAVLGTTWAWALAAFLVGWLIGDVRRGGLAGAAALLVADVT